MSTTAAIVEILVAGFLALIWLSMLIFSQASSAQADQLNTFFERYKDYDSVILLGLLVLSYQLGWLVNACTYWLGKLYMVPLRRKVFGDSAKREVYDRIKAEVYAWPNSERIAKALDTHVAVDRIARAGGLNFLILAGVALFTDFHLLPALSIVFALLGLGCWAVAFDRHYRYYKYLSYAWDICQADQRESSSGSPIGPAARGRKKS